jgi:hypothetical protein
MSASVALHGCTYAGEWIKEAKLGQDDSLAEQTEIGLVNRLRLLPSAQTG